jgi:hypothetical protein
VKPRRRARVVCLLPEAVPRQRQHLNGEHSIIIEQEKKNIRILTYRLAAMSEPVSRETQRTVVHIETHLSPAHAASINPRAHGHQHHQHHHPASRAQQHQYHNANEHAEAVMATFHDQMLDLAYKNTPESAEEAHDIAHMLLERAQLPLAFRVRAHVVLASGKTAYLHHAREAVRFAEMGRDIYGPGSTPESRAAVQDLLWEAREALRRAERDMELFNDINQRIQTGDLKLKKGENISYGNVNGRSTAQDR